MHDVVIVGAGPVGLFVACELGLAGCSVLVLEREPDTGSPWRAAPLGMRGLFAASVEAFQRRGLLDALLSASGPQQIPGTDSSGRRGVGHFAGIVLDPSKVDTTALPYRLPSQAPDVVMTDLETIESVLAERAARLGVEIRRGVTVSDIAQYDDKVVLYAGEDEYPARWAVGCDGGRSTVRKLAGFAFAGTEPQFTGYTVLATLADPEKLNPGINLTPTGMYLKRGEGHLGFMDFDGGAFDRSQEPTREHLQTVLRRVSGTDVTLTSVQLSSTFTDRAKQATTYRQGRVLLAGDAAHIMSPLGGQGLNTGIGDAINLGWKLAATVLGHAPDGLLDTYTAERRPPGALALDWTRAQVAAMRPDPHSQAVQSLIRDLLATTDGTTYVYRKFSGASIRYDLGDPHPLVGHVAPDFELESGVRLSDLMQDGRGVLLDFHADLRASAWETRIRYVAAAARDDLGLDAVLVRPDGVIAWAGDAGTFEQAARQWFGSAEVSL
ncbi:FAD-dependent oxidoreductase [Amycolatopsis sp. NPDC059657]|uniref:FAD-dependent oxidoreductase n=1 Tax=Amycolatopsis sp. NPDC059657 TaxID=3346899 RepID=UPI0036723338